ncbi:MAG: DUF192 domain-containing protein [Campylobacteraceae bacterium]|jgi:uncharacterized membrane protein (UPF0127 family)|nr:DUF192 domain-containing protein [Campylobacteraceae bacterium]
MVKIFILSFLIFLGISRGEVLPLCSLEFDSGFKIEKLPQANTPKARQKGLSNLDDVKVGMIFTWDEAAELSFWMKDTKVALSIGFFDDNGELFQIDDMEPYSLAKHYSIKKAKSALELNQGDFEKQGINIGAKITKLECR